MTTKSKYGLNWIFQKTKGTRFHLVLLIFFVMLVNIITISFAYFIKIFMDIATGDIEQSLVFTGLIALAVICAGGIITIIISVIAKYIYGNTERNLRTELMDVILSRRLINISKQHTGELMTKLTVDIQAVSECYINIIRNLVGGIALALFAAASMFFLNWKMAIIMLVLTPVLMLVMGIFTPFMQKASEKDKHNDEINRSIMQENLSRIMLIKAYFMQNNIVGKIHSSYKAKLKSGIKLGKWEGLVSFSGEVISVAMFIVTIGVGAYFVLQGETTLGSLIGIVQLLNYVVMPVSGFAVVISQIGQAVASSERIGMIYELPPDKKMIRETPVDAFELVIENLNFSYNEIEGENNDKNILENVNLSFKKGTVTGLAGKSGSGKSTLLKLLIGLYTPNQGNIELKHTLGILNGEEIMPQIAYVPPSDYLFSGTVSENIKMSEIEVRLEDMKNAASNANIIDFIEALPNGFDTLIGESGGTVSSGQAQRLAIARAIYKKSPVIVFDEPTANLDIDSIERFQTAIKHLAKDKICIIVTHDTSTINICDKVYLIKDRNVRERLDNEILDIDT
jgi:ABC-type bacteriocin/lantibiotic exporter with double-glycine peptidase domain